jgi:hypothetical protein
MLRAAALCLLALCLAWGCKGRKGAPAPHAASPQTSPAATQEEGAPPVPDKTGAKATPEETAAALAAASSAGTARKVAPFVYSSLERLPAAGTVEGKVLFEGEPPANEPLIIPEDFAAEHPAAATHCAGRNLKHDDIVVLAGGLSDAVVEIRGITRGKRRLKQALIQASNCRYQPRVVLAPRGNTLVMVNSDPFEHRLRVRGPGPGAFFDGLFAPGDKVRTNEAQIPGVYALSCDLQPWLEGHVYVVEHPYFAVTGIGGAFRIEDVPPGKHPARVWHPVLGERSGEVEVSDGAVAKLVFRYTQ